MGNALYVIGNPNRLTANNIRLFDSRKTKARNLNNLTKISNETKQ